MKINLFSKYLEKLEKTSSRLEITAILAEFLERSQTDDVNDIVNLLLGRLAPNFESIIFNVAEKMMLNVIARAYSFDIHKVKDKYRQYGDIGNVAFELARTNNQKQIKRNINISDVYSKLIDIARCEGEGSQDKKIDMLAELLKSLDPLSAKYVARIPVGKLRLGFSDKTVIDAISWMVVGDKSFSKELEGAYQVYPDVGLLAKKVKKYGIKKAVESSFPVVGVPVLPMLAQRLKTASEMIEKMGEVAVEPKLDGLRVLVHYKRGKNGFVKTYTRNMNETSWMFPELLKLGKYTNVDSAVFDTEAVGLDEKTKAMANFQTTMTRRRKHDIESTSKKVSITFYIFDLLAYNKKNLMGKAYLMRRKVLKKVLKNNPSFKLVDNEITKNPKRIFELNDKYHKEGYEGIMVKRVTSRYVPGRTGWRWVKMKEVEGDLGKLSDTIDAVVMGYTGGKGKRVGFGVGQFLAGIKVGNKIKTITKVGTGLTDKQFRELRTRLGKLTTKIKPKEYELHKDLNPDFWVEPSLVVELAADEITKSPRHSSGFALRFPRLVRFRDDKSWDQATNIDELKEIAVN